MSFSDLCDSAYTCQIYLVRKHLPTPKTFDMKKYLLQTAIVLILISTLNGCKKSNDSAANKYGATINGKTWWGTVTIPGQKPQNYSVHYNADSSFVWNEQVGEYLGHWSITDNHLTLTFSNVDAVFTADISGDNTLTNLFTSNTFTVNNSELIPNPFNKPLGGTVWKGKFTNYDGVVSDIEMDFVDDSHMNAIFWGGKLYYLYDKSASGIVFSTRPAMEDFNQFFGVIITENQMVGTDADPTRTFQVTLQ